MKILWFDHRYSDCADSGGQRSHDLARSLVEAGHEVTIVCATDLISRSGLGGPWLQDRREGAVDRIRVVEFDLAGGASAGRRIAARLRYFAGLARMALDGRVDLTVCNSDSLSGLFPALLSRLLRRRPFVFDARSLHSRIKMGHAPAGRKSGVLAERVRRGLYSAVEKGACRLAAKVIASGDNIAEAVAAYGAERFNIHVVPPLCKPCPEGVSQQELPPDLSAKIGKGSLVAVFAGPVEPEYGLDAVLDAAMLLKLRERHDIAILLVGEGSDRAAIARVAAERRLDNVTVVGALSRKKLATVLSGCDIGLQLLCADPDVHAGAAPGAFADYLAARLPVLVNYPGWLAGLVAQHDCGFALRMGDSAGFADALEQAADHRNDLKKMAHNTSGLEGLIFDREIHLTGFCEAVEEVLVQAQARAGQVSKRLFDISLALTGLVFLAPVMVLAALVVRGCYGRPVLSRQTCPGFFGRPVELLTFRTLRNAYRPDGGVLSDEERQGFPGSTLEATRTASLPLLWNILRGDISFVGPAILPMQDLSRLSSDAFRRHFVRPGLTGWAQVLAGGKHESQGNELARDVWYVENHSLSLDLKILAAAVLQSFRPGRVPLDLIRRSAGVMDGSVMNGGAIDGEVPHKDKAVL